MTKVYGIRLILRGPTLRVYRSPLTAGINGKVVSQGKAAFIKEPP